MAPRSISLLFLAIAIVAGRLGVVALPTKYTWINVPYGVTYDKSSDSVCIPASWTDIATFFLGNYVAHAATVVTFPGEPSYFTFANMVLAMLWPSFGCGRGLVAIFRCALFSKDSTEQALRSSALCMVVRTPSWEPAAGEIMRSVTYMPKCFDDEKSPFVPYFRLCKRKEFFGEYIKELQNGGPVFTTVCDYAWRDLDSFRGSFRTISQKHRIFGHNKLPSGYEYVYVPPNAALEPMSRHTSAFPSCGPEIIQSSHSLGSPLVAVFQIVYAAAALYQSQGYQVRQYGYAAFGFTVLPYLVMSFINLLGNLVTPNYDSIYLVHTEIMDEAIKRGGQFTDVIATLPSEPTPVDDTFLVSGSVQINQEFGTELSITNIRNIGDLEPISESSSNIDAPFTTREMVSRPERGGRPSLVFPDCYNFKTVYKRKSLNIRDLYFVPCRTVAIYILGGLISCTPLMVMGCMSSFDTGTSSLAQRVWTLTWLVVGITCTGDPYIVESLIGRLEMLTGGEYKLSKKEKILTRLTLLSLYSSLCALTAISLGRMVIVAQMIFEYGTCMSVD